MNIVAFDLDAMRSFEAVGKGQEGYGLWGYVYICNVSVYLCVCVFVCGGDTCTYTSHARTLYIIYIYIHHFCLPARANLHSRWLDGMSSDGI